MASKIDENKDLMVEVNIAEAPMFCFTRGNKNKSVKSLLEDSNTTDIAREVLSGIYKENKSATVGYRNWTDSSGNERELIIASVRGLPDAYCMDVFIGLVKLMIKYNTPMIENENGKYEFKSNKVEFTLNELCDAMEIKAGGNTYSKIKEALRKLKSANYYSIGAGSIYDKSKKAYETRSERAISLIDSYDTSEILKNDEGQVNLLRGYVTFGELVMRNLFEGFVRIIRNHQYFQLKTGIARGLYLYIASNKIESTIYEKRSYEVLRNKIPIEYKYPSDLKSKIKKSLDSMVEMGIMKDFFYGDEILINGVKEHCIYLIFKGTRKQLIDSLTKKPKKIKEEKKNDLETDYKMIFPVDLNKELIDLGINSKKIAEIMHKYSKWKIGEYILWIKDGIAKGKVKDSAAMFVFAITDEMVKVGKTHPEIIEFVGKIKSDVEGKTKVSKKLIDEAYKKYIDNELAMFREEEEFAYEATMESIIDDIEKVQSKRIKSQRMLYNMAKTDEEKDKLLSIIEKWEKFSVQREESEIFIEQFVKKIKILRELKDYEEFKQEYIAKNK